MYSGMAWQIHGVLDMLQREAGMGPAEAMKFARKWLAEHTGEGRLAPDDLDEELAEKREREDARRRRYSGRASVNLVKWCCSGRRRGL